jgi:transcriptional regulator with XRE-family HTH domain
MAKPSPSYAGADTLVALGGAIRRERKKKGISQEQLALSADLDRSYVGGVERGEHNLTIMTIVKLADALKVNPRELL